MTVEVRRTQADRRDAMRTRILDAALDSLVESGYAETSTSAVQKRAGVPRGTLLHHFPTKVDLLVGAIQHLADRRIEQLARDFASMPESPDRIRVAVDLAWRIFSGPSFWAALDLWAAARSDADLRAALLPVESQIFQIVHVRLKNIFEEGFPDDPRVPTLVEFTVEVATGLSMSILMSGDVGKGELLIRRWRRAVAILLGELDPSELIEGVSPGKIVS